jgi:hypothetical protein
MSALSDLIRNEDADSSLAFRERVYRRGDQHEMLRDVIALANASVVGRRFLFLGVSDRPGGERRFPGITERSWKSFSSVFPAFLEHAVEPPIPVSLQAVDIDGALIGAVCLDICDDPPYLLARRISESLPAGGGWIRSGTRQERLLRKHLQKIFEARFQRQECGDIAVGFPGDLPREELVLPVMPLEALPSEEVARKLNRMIDARRVSKAVLGRSDTRIARLVHAQVVGSAEPYRERGTKTLRALVRKAPLEHLEADAYYQFETRAHRLNLLLNNLSDRAQKDLTLTLKFPRIDGVGVADRIHSPPGERSSKHGPYPKVDVGPRTIVVQARGLEIPFGGSIAAFYEPLRLLLREEVAGQTIRVAYSLQGPTLGRPVRGRLKILAID